MRGDGRLEVGARVRIGRPRQVLLAKPAKPAKLAKPAKPAKAAKKESDKPRQASKPASRAEMIGRKGEPTVAAKPIGARRHQVGAEPLAGFEKALASLHGHDWKAAAGQLRGLLERFPDEIEMLDRVNSYLRICERYLKPPSFEPKSADDHYQVGVLCLNQGALEDAVRHLEKAISLDASSDKSEYALAVALAQREERGDALAHLRRSIELNPDNRIFAASDSDLEAVRDDPEFLDIAGRKPERRTGSGAVAGKND